VRTLKRYTFVVQIHPGGLSTLENLSTQERVEIVDLTALCPQIERWLAVASISPQGAGEDEREHEGRR
jgi:hypothetical protein